MDGQERESQLPSASGKSFKDRHGAIQAFTTVCALVLCGFLGSQVVEDSLKAYDALLLGGTFWAVAIAFICSHAYNYQPGREAPGSLRDTAAKLEAVWHHANFCWQIISAWMTVTPLYCTCATIYISGSSAGGGWDQVHVLVYSILSLVLSLGIYVIRPSNRAAGYRKAYLCVAKALCVSPAHDPGDEKVREAIIAGQEIIAAQDILDPK